MYAQNLVIGSTLTVARKYLGKEDVQEQRYDGMKVLFGGHHLGRKPLVVSLLVHLNK